VVSIPSKCAKYLYVSYTINPKTSTHFSNSIMSDIARVILNYSLCKFSNKNFNFNLLQQITNAITCKKIQRFHTDYCKRLILIIFTFEFLDWFQHNHCKNWPTKAIININWKVLKNNYLAPPIFEFENVLQSELYIYYYTLVTDIISEMSRIH
jgi:hypothetical protein